MLQLRHALSLLAACLLATSVLEAQLDPRLQSSPTDFLDLYQGSKSKGGVRPEVLLVMDFSTSTNQMMYHRLFPNNFNDEDNNNYNSRTVNIYVKIQSGGGQGGGGGFSIQQVGFGDGRLRTQMLISSHAYRLGGNRVGPDGSTPAYNTLIKPDGTEVTEEDVRQTVKDSRLYRSMESTPQAFALNWVRCASHVRIRCTDDGEDRTVDFPINWAVLDASSRGTPLSRVTVTNPHDRQAYEIDSVYLRGSNGGWYEPMREVDQDPLTVELGAMDANVRLYRTRYIEWIFWGMAGNAYFIPDAVEAKRAVDPNSITFDNASQTYHFSSGIFARQAFGNGLPNLSRNQAIKHAFLRTWFNYQGEVNFAYRTLYGLTGMSESSGRVSIPYAFDTNRWGLLNPDDPSTWTIITEQVPDSTQGTPLVPTQFDAYCQMTNASAFAGLETYITNDDLPCIKHFLILLTDGAPNFNLAAQPIEQPYSFPYLSRSGGKSTYAGNLAVQNSLSSLDQGNNFWNNATLAAVAAHGGQAQSSSNPKDWVRDPRTGPIGKMGRPEDWAPFWISKRMVGDQLVNLETPHPIQTMTVGVSLGSHYQTENGDPWPPDRMLHDDSLVTPIAQDLTGSKYRLLMTALSGDPAVTELEASSVKPYYVIEDPDTRRQRKASDSVYYFDARDPGLLVSQLDQAFRDILEMSRVTSTTAPVIPYVGLGLGREIYITRFQPRESATTPVWTGDLVMFPTRIKGDTIQLLNGQGNPITGFLETEVPRWSGDNALRRNRLWSARQVWTRLPGKDDLCRFTPFDDGTGGAPKNAFRQLKGSIAKSLADDAGKQRVIAWNLGASLGDLSMGLNPASPNRSLPGGQTTIVPPGDLLGDIIDSTPSSIEYTLTDAIIKRLPPKLKAEYNAAPPNTAHFRVVFVGTNRGFLHAFGEITYTKVSGSGERVVDGEADELWAFLPTDFLENLDTISPMAAGFHRFGVNGIPFTWFHDKPGVARVLGNERADPGEPAMLVFGLGKGGRSYYGLNIEDPFTPKLGWALVPDEAASLSANRLDPDGALGQNGLSSLKSIVSRMGFSSCIPAAGRVLMGATPKFRDVLFLGGGYAMPEIEANFGMPFSMGRSALALDILTGKVLAAWDFTSSGMGPVASGLVPFASFPDSGLVQRAYFTDYAGGIWALGCGRTNPDGLFRSFRRDSSAMDAWTVDGKRGSAMALRHVYQDDPDQAWRARDKAPQNAIYSMRPAPFQVPNFPGLASLKVSDLQQATISPATVGVAVISGDRDNPVDRNYTDANRPKQHRVTVVWDRQDSARGELAITSGCITNDRLVDFTAQAIPPSSDVWNDRGGLTLLGYYLNLPPAAPDRIAKQVFVPKGIYEPAVLDGALFFSYFTPSNATCFGGAGKTSTTRICDVIFPSWPGPGRDADTQDGCRNGVVGTWLGVTSPFAPLNASTILVGGAPTAGMDGSSGLKIKSFQGATGERAPRVRTWRTVR